MNFKKTRTVKVRSRQINSGDIENDNPKIFRFQVFLDKLLNGHEITEKCSYLELGAIYGAAREELRHCGNASEEDRTYEVYLNDVYHDVIAYLSFKDDDVYGWDEDKPPRV